MPSPGVSGEVLTGAYPFLRSPALAPLAPLPFGVSCPPDFHLTGPMVTRLATFAVVLDHLPAGSHASDVCADCHCSWGTLPAGLEVAKAPAAAAARALFVLPDPGTDQFRFTALADGLYRVSLTMLSGTSSVAVRVDTVPPAVAGTLEELTHVPQIYEPAAASDQPTVQRRWALATFHFSEAVRGFRSTWLTVSNAAITEMRRDDSFAIYYVLLASHEGALVEVTLRGATYADLAGNPGSNDVDLRCMMSGASTAAQVSAADIGGAASTVAVAIAVPSGIALPTASFSQAFSAKSGVLQSSYHVQMLAMTSQLASPGICSAYKTLARYFRWSVLSIKGSVPLLDNAFGDAVAVVHDPTKDPIWPANATTFNSTAEAAVDFWPANTINITDTRRRHRMLLMVTHAGGPDAAVGAVVGPQASRELLQSATQAPPPTPEAPPAAQPPPAVPLVQDAVVKFQDLLYTLAVAAIIMSAVVVLHTILAVAYLLIVSKELHPYLTFPRIEFIIGGLIIIALTFYSCLAIGGSAVEWRDSKTAAVVVLMTITTPYTLFLWWLALGRMSRPLLPWELEMPGKVMGEDGEEEAERRRPGEDLVVVHIEVEPQRRLTDHGRPPSAKAPEPATALPERQPSEASSSDESEEDLHIRGPHWHKFQGPTFEAVEEPNASSLPALAEASSPTRPVITRPGVQRTISRAAILADQAQAQAARRPSYVAHPDEASHVYDTARGKLAPQQPLGESIESDNHPGGFPPIPGVSREQTLPSSLSLGAFPSSRRSARVQGPNSPTRGGPSSPQPLPPLRRTNTSEAAASSNSPQGGGLRKSASGAFLRNSTSGAVARTSPSTRPDMVQSEASVGQQQQPPLSPPTSPPRALSRRHTLSDAITTASFTQRSQTAAVSAEAVTESRGGAEENSVRGGAAGGEGGPGLGLQAAAEPDGAAGTAAVGHSASARRWGRWLGWWNWAVPSESMLKRFDFLFEDMLGEAGPLRRDPCTAKTIATAMNFTHKAVCAIVFGCFGLEWQSWTQLALLMGAQTVMLAYLIVVWPYLEWQLQWLELVCHLLEGVIFICAMVLVDVRSEGVDWIMICCFFIIVTLLLIFEIRRIYIMLCSAYAMWQEHRQKRRQAAALRQQQQQQDDQQPQDQQQQPLDQLPEVQRDKADLPNDQSPRGQPVGDDAFPQQMEQQDSAAKEVVTTERARSVSAVATIGAVPPLANRLVAR